MMKAFLLLLKKMMRHYLVAMVRLCLNLLLRLSMVAWLKLQGMG
uniref:Uncharacterized protein n=1 Tax=Arundo donax TaxID=35708 RepID=A0A0A9EF13_ARUDO